jgi:hypothetical protein
VHICAANSSARNIPEGNSVLFRTSPSFMSQAPLAQVVFSKLSSSLLNASPCSGAALSSFRHTLISAACTCVYTYSMHAMQCSVSVCQWRLAQHNRCALLILLAQLLMSSSAAVLWQCCLRNKARAPRAPLDKRSCCISLLQCPLKHTSVQCVAMQAQVPAEESCAQA